MPIYEYECKDCGHRLEALRKISDPPLLDCPSCGKSALNKLMSATSFRLKGGGWYETDFKTGSRRHGTGSEGGDSAANGSSKASSKGDSAETSQGKEGKSAGDSASAGKDGSGPAAAP